MGTTMKKTPESQRGIQRAVYGSGSIYWIKSRNCWELKKFVGTVTRKELRTQGKTKADCYAKMKVKEAEYLKHEGITLKDSGNKKIMLQDAIYEWLYTFKQRDLKEKSFDTCMGTFNNQIKGTDIGERILPEINETIIQQYLNKLADRYSFSTVKKTYSLLKQFFEYWYRKDYHQNPMLAVKAPSKCQTVPVFQDFNMEKGHISALSDVEIDKLTTELEKPYIAGKRGYKYGYALLFILWSYVRIGEALALTWSDVNWERKTVSITKALVRTQKRDKDGKLTNGVERKITLPKTKSSNRVIALCPKALRYLKLYHDSVSNDTAPESFIFTTASGKHVSEQQLHRNLADACIRANLPHISIHDLRHTGISFFIRKGYDVKVISRLAGHSDVSTTMRIYYNLVKEQIENPYADLYQLIEKKADAMKTNK